MKFSPHQKEIIRKIASGEVCDITSYIKAFNLSTLKKYDTEDIKKRLKESENGKTYKTLKSSYSTLGSAVRTNDGRCIMGGAFPTEDDFEQKEAELNYNHSTQVVECGEEQFNFDYCQGVNITPDFSAIKDFITVWQILKADGLVFETDKNVTKEDYEPFFDCQPIKETHYYKLRKAIHTQGITIRRDLTPAEPKITIPHEEAGRVKDFRDYVDFLFKYNTSKEQICKQFIGKQIFGNGELDVFIKRGFRTRERVEFILALIPAYLSLVLTLGITIWQECTKDNTDIKIIQTQLSEIQQQLENYDTLSPSDLDSIEQQLESLLQEDSKQTEEINKKIDALIEAIQELQLTNSQEEPGNP